MLASTALIALAALALPAHLDPLAGRDPFVVDGAFVGGATSWGLVLRASDAAIDDGIDGGIDDGIDDGIGDGVDDGGAPFLRVCEEATGGAALLAHRVPDGRVIVATQNGMIETDDGGCSWTPVASVLANLEVSALVAAQDDPSIVYLSTSRAGAPNGIWKSVDGGATFAETALAGTINPLVELAVAADGHALAVTGFDLDENLPLLRVSADGGGSFAAPTSPAFEGIAAGEIVGMRVLAVDDAQRVWLAVFTAGDPAIMSADLALTELRNEGSFDLDAVALVPFAGTHYALIRPGALYRREPLDGSWTVIDDVTPSCLRRVAGDARLWACTVAPAQFAVSDDGVTFEPVLLEQEVGARACPADTFAAQVCVYDVDPLEPDEFGSAGFPDASPFEAQPVPVIDAPGDDDDDDNDDNDDNSDNDDPLRNGCGGAGVPLAFVLALIVVRRRA